MLVACVGEWAGGGFAHYIFHAHCRYIEDVCYLQDLYTDPAYRGQGIGRALVQGVYEEADNVGHRRFTGSPGIPTKMPGHSMTK